MDNPLVQQLNKMRRYSNTAETADYTFRRKQILKLRDAVLKYEKELQKALNADLGKSPEESWVTETGFLLTEITHTLKHLRSWMKRERTGTNLLNFPARSFIYKEPLGVVLIIGPWNYPLQLLFTPLIGAIAAGNCVVLKPSEFAPETGRVIQKIIEETYVKDYIFLVQGEGNEVIPPMMNNFQFDHVFYTGSTVVGRIIYEMAAKKLVPVTLELGGKSPCVVDSDANLKVAARRIASTKFSNAGQMCVAPDYVLVHESIRSEFLTCLKETLKQFYSENAAGSYNYGRVINAKQFNRLINYLKEGEIIYGGGSDLSTLYFEPTIMENISLDATIMGEEIFGPVLPVISFKTFEEAKAIINRNKNPLAFYVFTESKEKGQRWINEISFGGGCINNASWHFTNFNLPFGGRGNSGIGAYHGKYSFDTFSHRKSIMKTPTWFDPKIKYPPLEGKLKLFKRFIR
ncbi:MAG TPA: aldehyde dehydrogenase [Flavisolibacter sp.]|nr:aldehyde dehydrogenase [Flavisolibacter sp.]